MISANTAQVPGVQLRPLAGRIGAQICGVSVGGELDSATVAELRRALLRYKVIFFRGQQQLRLADLEAFGRLFGTLAPHPTIAKVDGTENALNIVYADAAHAANEWHLDESYLDRYHLAGILHAITLPVVGGDTMWANTAAAYESLPAPLKVLAESLWALHANRSEFSSSRRDPRETNTLYRCEQPVVHVHPETGERCLLLGFHAKKILGVSLRDSQRLHDIFQDYIERAENTVRWHWELGDVAFWDNRATQHYGIGDFSERRELNRISLQGEAAVAVDGRRSVPREAEELWVRPNGG